MRDSDISLTMNSYTHARLLDTAEAMESQGIVRETAQRKLAPALAPNRGETGRNESIPDHPANCREDAPDHKKPAKHWVL
jgi:hypothetical protein